MTADAATTSIITLAAQHYGKAAADLAPTADIFDGLGIDSFAALDLLSRLEEHFKIEIPDWELQGVTTFAGLGDVVARRVR